MSAGRVVVQLDEGVASIEIHRPEKHNALSTQILLGLQRELQQLAEQGTVRAVVLTSAGDAAFIAGGDIAEMSSMTRAEAHDYIELGQACTRAFEELPCPTIAAISGHALGGGLELAMACDCLIAADTARLGLPEVRLGIIPGFGGTQRLARRIGYSRAQWMVLTAEPISADQALAWGLVHQVLPKAEVREAAQKLARQFARGPSTALSCAKRALLAAGEGTLNGALAIEASLFAEAFTHADSAEGLGAFVARREPQFGINERQPISRTRPGVSGGDDGHS
jgi:enoyl-CoA hydratase